MKRFGKVLLALTALLGVFIAGGIWLFVKTLNVVSDAVDNSLSSPQKVQSAGQKEDAGTVQSAQNGAEPSLVAMDKTAVDTHTSTPQPANKVADQTANVEKNKETSIPAAPAAKKPTKDTEDIMSSVGGLLSLFLNDGDDSLDPTVLLASGDKTAKGDKADSANSEESLTDMIPGANSPTVKRWMAGKYKGKESQALDDAIEDPKLWRLFFSLSGGM